MLILKNSANIANADIIIGTALIFAFFITILCWKKKWKNNSCLYTLSFVQVLGSPFVIWIDTKHPTGSDKQGSIVPLINFYCGKVPFINAVTHIHKTTTGNSFNLITNYD